MKKLLTVLFAGFLMLTCMTGNVYAEESALDYNEEIKMFQDFYEHPDTYIFQDVEGNDVTAFVLEHKESFYRDSYHTTDMLMDTVKSVQEEPLPVLTELLLKARLGVILRSIIKRTDTASIVLLGHIVYPVER
ncbi:MAG: hypothetical protein ACLTDX_25125 [[Clostridium] innocuum]